jgi:hypothetical protein
MLMQDATPQGEPRLQCPPSGPETTTGFVDPCIVFLETTLAGETPLVVACWARSSREVRDPGRHVRLELRNALVFESRRHGSAWVTTRKREKSLTLKHGVGDATPGSSYFSTMQSSPPPIFQWAIRYLDFETDAALRKQSNVSLSPNSRHPSMTKQIFNLAQLDWPSIAQIIAFEEKLERRRSKKPQPSLLRRFISSVFKKKPKLANA